MELPTLAEFKVLLEKDKLFRDYFNAFLNLPIFAKRLTYCSGTNKFNIEPRIKSCYHTLNENGIWLWILDSRLPLFWGSDLHLECRLSQCLTQSAPPVGEGEWGMAGMDEFKQFLCQNEGQCLWLFWKDTERLRLSKDKQHIQKVFRHIQLNYLQDGSPFAVPKCIRERAVLCASREHLLRNSVCRVELLLSTQSLALDELLKYWTLRFNIHQETSPCLAREGSGKYIPSTFSSGVNEEAVTAYCTLLPSILYDQGGPGNHYRAERAPHIKLSCVSLPSLVPVNGNEPTHCREGYIEQMITPSTQQLFSQARDCSTPDSSLLHELPVLPFMVASLRADALSGHPFLHYLSKQRHTASAHLLFWQSVETLLVQDELRRGRGRNTESLRWEQLLYYEDHPVARDLGQLVELFLRPHSPHRVDLPEGMRRRELCVLVAKGLGYNLLLSAQEHSAKTLLTHWQGYLCSDHQSFMGSCTNKKVLRHNIRRRLGVEHSPLPNELVSMVFDPSTLTSAWRALRYAEAAKYHGVHFLRSRTSLPTHSLAPPTNIEELVLDLTEIDAPLTVEGVALTPMVTTICDQLLYDWERSKVKRSLLYTVTHSYDSTKRPQIPENITEVLKNREQLEFFRHYLFIQGSNAETPLQFWMAVEDIKASLNNGRSFTNKLKRIQEKFFVGRGGNSPLNIHPVLYELSKRNSPTILELIAAQMEIIKSVEKNWFNDYVADLKAKKEEENKKEEKKPTCRASTKGLWSMFARNVISFRHGLMNSATAQQFRDFLRNEAVKGNNTGHSKKVIGTKVVYVTKLINDLSFWAEVERYKDLVDLVWAGKEKGTSTPEDEIMIHKKAHAIINCYIDSSVSPRIQINIPPDLATYILDNLSQGQVTRGLFHEAALNIFSVLILYWKKFCVHRFVPKEMRSPTNMDRGRADSLFPDYGDHHGHRERKFSSIHFFWDGGPTLSFNLTSGLRWHYPPNYHLLLSQERAAATNTSQDTPTVTA